MKAVGFNRFAAEYGGIDIKKNTMISMAISGGLAGLAGAVQVLGVSQNIGLWRPNRAMALTASPCP